jgi:hypothetical protein
MARDPKTTARAKVIRDRAVVAKCQTALDNARRNMRRSLLSAVDDAGCTKAELARDLHTGEQRVRQMVEQARIETGR